MNQVGISAVVPIKNGEKYINKSIQQLALNLDENDEIIVVNDGSTDGTLSKLKEWASSDDRVVVLDNPKPGLTHALNLGIKESHHNWIARFDVDDKYTNNRIKIQRDSINTNTSLIFSDYDNIGVDGTQLGTIPTAIFPSTTALSMISSQRTAHPSVIISKEAFVEAGGYLAEDFPAEDISLWLRMIKYGEAISVPKTLLHYQISPNSVSATRYLTAKEKTGVLLRKYPISSVHFNNVLENFKVYAKLYSEEEYSVERIILMYRDLLQYVRVYPNTKSLKISNKLLNATFNCIQQEKFLKSVFKLREESFERKKEKSTL